MSSDYLLDIFKMFLYSLYDNYAHYYLMLSDLVGQQQPSNQHNCLINSYSHTDYIDLPQKLNIRETPKGNRECHKTHSKDKKKKKNHKKLTKNNITDRTKQTNQKKKTRNNLLAKDKPFLFLIKQPSGNSMSSPVKWIFRDDDHRFFVAIIST